MSTRTFVAAELPDAAREALELRIAILSRALPRVRFQSPESLHLTLAFLGNLDDEQLDRAMEATCLAVATGASGPLTLTVGTLGTFGPAYAPRVLWVGVGGQVAALQRLQAALADELSARGFAREERPFSPHLTLARFKQPLDSSALRRLTEHLAAPHAPETPFVVDALSVMKSELFSAGAQYTRLLMSPLGGTR